LPFAGSADALRSATPQPVATERGYENQPFFSNDGRAILFTANRDRKQTDIYEFDRIARRIRQLVATPEAEYSATITPDGAGFSVIRVEADGTQRLWRFDRNGTNPRVVLTDIKPVGYHAWIDENRLVLFVLGQPPTLQLASVATGKAEIKARDIGRSLHRMADRRSVSFVQREADGEHWVKALEPASGAITPIVRAAPGSTARDCAWLPDGTLLMSSGTRILAHRPSASAKPADVVWHDVFDAAAHQLGDVTRMAVAPDGKTLAIVVNEAARR
jgi:dipeptidyl aminopeptidase/acylaminoacyl peptidase